MNIRPLLALLTLTAACSSSPGTPSGSSTKPDPSGDPTPGQLGDGSSSLSRSASGEIEVSAPGRSTEVTSPMTIRGRARVFEGRVNFRLRSGPHMVAEGSALATAPDAGQFGPFEGTVSWKGPLAGTRAELEVYAIRASDGAPDHVVTIPVLLK